MYFPGHLGASLIVSVPFVAAFAAMGEVPLAVLGGAVIVWFAMLPDVDHKIPFVDHRGPTHTLAFAAVVGALFGAVGTIAEAELGITPAVSLGVFGAVLGVTTVGAHLLADVLTPSGVAFLWPLSAKRYSLRVCRADNPVGNYCLLLAGIAVAVGGGVAVVRIVGI